MALLLNKVENSLLQILKTEIGWHDSDTPIAVPLGRMMKIQRLAKEHTVLGLVAQAVCKGRVMMKDSSPVSSVLSSEKVKEVREDIVMNLMQVDVLHQRKYKKFSSALTEFSQLMERHHIPYVVFKGLAVAQFYPFPHTRTMGDVDFYVPDSDFARAVEVLESSWHLKIDKEDIDKHFCFTYQGIRFEMHYQVETFGYGRHQRYFNRMIDDSILKETRAMLPPMEDLIVVFRHWFNHLLVEGVGLRQTIDMAVLLNAYQDKVDAQRLQSHLKNIGYERAFKAMVAMVETYLGLSCAQRYCLLAKRDYQYGDKLMAVVLESGNFGRRAYSNQVASKEKSLETAKRALGHCLKFFWLAPMDILCLVPRRIVISLKQKI